MYFPFTLSGNEAGADWGDTPSISFWELVYNLTLCTLACVQSYTLYTHLCTILHTTFWEPEARTWDRTVQRCASCTIFAQFAYSRCAQSYILHNPAVHNLTHFAQSRCAQSYTLHTLEYCSLHNLLYNLTLYALGCVKYYTLYFAHHSVVHNLTLCTLSLRVEYCSLHNLLHNLCSLHNPVVQSYTGKTLGHCVPLLPWNCLLHNYQCCFSDCAFCKLFMHHATAV